MDDIQRTKLIESHIEECKHRISVINGFMEISSDADEDSCCENILRLKNTISALEELQQYRQIGTPEQCREAVEKQQALRPIKEKESRIRYTDGYICPKCGGGFAGTGIADYCYHCGQAIDWSDTE
ncbi:MAG: hypothetical protein Q4F83_11050 [Eubacteriales bacterium]|nr:hypothetical protein [Eubacteriales bacterium]